MLITSISCSFSVPSPASASTTIYLLRTRCFNRTSSQLLWINEFSTTFSHSTSKLVCEGFCQITKPTFFALGEAWNSKRLYTLLVYKHSFLSTRWVIYSKLGLCIFIFTFCRHGYSFPQKMTKLRRGQMSPLSLRQWKITKDGRKETFQDLVSWPGVITMRKNDGHLKRGTVYDFVSIQMLCFAR